MTTTQKNFKNAFDYDGAIGEINNLPSLTQPDMTMSLKTLLERYTRGGEVATFTPVYQDVDDFDQNPEFEKMDATEKLQYALDLKMAIKRSQERPPKVVPKNEPPVEPAKPAEAPKAEPVEAEQKQ